MESQDRDWAKDLGLDRLPTHIVGKRVADLLDLSGKKAIVTGAGGDGLGHAIANRLAGSGADVALVGRTFSKVQRRATEIEEKWGVKAVPILADLSDWDQVHRAVRESHDALGGLDIMINNPVMVVGGPFARHTKEDIDRTVLGSLTMLMYGAHAALEFMLPQGSGRIINISAEAGRIATPGLVVYGASKSGVIGFTRGLASEVASQGVYVMCVAPGIMIKADLQERIVNAQTDGDRVARDSVLQSLATQVQLGRVGLPEEVANMVAYVASEAADYMCGQTIDVSGGMYMN
ncbi:SDR family NAD(P)-dependent oxidoreductase [Frankia sp. AgB1.9]|uniref:SDR family NAD(P)-dependent oxidoreductase n=1 Tax=unclassified Frankia TaxID=2632575 RepID=UPI00193184EA|nr:MULTISPECIES: SDR family NAD(P)-dependent oxidoreductase [unclassified Frankia]MBL7494578.1 SDR family NAD(P)-dependent oxidoreductase [Frankia sp. AgW1.1]MBL7550798.1 SDR family NAD(P)-dependent oxidoreductase [Frankia sp. AgB1.9]MBL7625528.1 SDR family NAD(P)-dependent oxidoreductase [Frankia sp. AgB1.8]